MRFLRLLPLLLLVPVVSQAQVCRPGKDQREAKMLAFFAAPIAFSPTNGPVTMRAGEISLGFDATYVPTPDDDIRHPEKCYTNSKTENTELSKVFPRPRLLLGLGAGWSVEATYLPPITVMDATPNLFAAALAVAREIRGGTMAWQLRAHATVGQVKGPITCSPDVIQTSNPLGTCYATTPSEDTYKPNMVGLEGVLGFGGGLSKVHSYLGLGVTSLRPRFKVGFTDYSNNVDTTRVEVDLVRVAAFAGASYQVNPRAALTVQLYSVPQDVTTIRVGGVYQLRRGR